jgi:outer membrane lipopolysaccharide assembly protein LptE/RlpB
VSRPVPRRAVHVRPLLLVGLATLAAGCGYRLSGTGPSVVLPEHVKVIAVMPFENRTARSEIEQRVTEAVAMQLSQRGSYRVVADPTLADAVLQGAVVRYTTTPVSFTPTGRTSRMEAALTLQASVRDRTNDQILWSQSGLIFKEQFDVPETGEFFQQESLALDLLARDAGGALVTSIIEGF